MTETVPGVEEIAAFLKLRDEMITDPDERTDEERAESARAILDLFAPILAEKERDCRQLKLEIGELEATSRISIYCWRDKANEMEAALAAAHDAYQQAAVDTLALLHEAEARALAAEAALAAAWVALEPFARADRALGSEPGPFRFETATGYRLIEREDLKRAGEAAAAIRAQGE